MFCFPRTPAMRDQVRYSAMTPTGLDPDLGYTALTPADPAESEGHGHSDRQQILADSLVTLHPARSRSGVRLLLYGGVVTCSVAIVVIFLIFVFDVTGSGQHRTYVIDDDKVSNSRLSYSFLLL